MAKLGERGNKLGNLVKYEEGTHIGYCRKVVTAQEAAATDYVIGTLLGRTLANGAAVPTADAGNTGDGTVTVSSVTGPAETGTYVIEVVQAAAAAGDFVFKDPDGKVLGYGTVGVAFEESGIAFTVNDGAVDWAVGDIVYLAVTGDEQYKISDPASSDGSEVIAAIVIQEVSLAAATDTDVVVLYRGPAGVADESLVLGNHTQADANAAVDALGIKVMERV